MRTQTFGGAYKITDQLDWGKKCTLVVSVCAEI